MGSTHTHGQCLVSSFCFFSWPINEEKPGIYSSNKIKQFAKKKGTNENLRENENYCNH